MAIIDNTPGLLEALGGEMVPKFLGTRSSDGAPNVVPCISLNAAADKPDTLYFGNFLLRKSIMNLEADKRVGILVITEALEGWILQGDFVEFQRTGPYVDDQMNSSLLRYNAYTGVRNAGIIQVTGVLGGFAISRLQVALDYLRTRLRLVRGAKKSNGNQYVKIPAPVKREFSRMVAVKVLAWVDDKGYPVLRPALSLQPSGPNTLTTWLGAGDLPVPEDDVRVASNILTFEAISYQAKGTWQTAGKAGVLHVQEVYAGGPPYPGGRVA